jgi:hypothetical protein
MNRFVCSAALVAIGAPVFADDAPFHQLVDESIGYVNVAPGIILIEDDVSSNICRVDLPEDYFAAYAADDTDAMAAAQHDIVCVPSVQLSGDATGRTPDEIPFSQMIDESIGYANIGPGILLVEDDVSSSVCRVEIDDTYFSAYAEADQNAMAQSAPSIICVPSPILTE